MVFENLITQEEFQRKTGKSRSWQWRARKSGELAYYSLNGRILYSEQQLQDFLKKYEVPSMNEELDQTHTDTSSKGLYRDARQRFIACHNQTCSFRD